MYQQTAPPTHLQPLPHTPQPQMRRWDGAGPRRAFVCTCLDTKAPHCTDRRLLAGWQSGGAGPHVGGGDGCGQDSEQLREAEGHPCSACTCAPGDKSLGVQTQWLGGDRGGSIPGQVGGDGWSEAPAFLPTGLLLDWVPAPSLKREGLQGPWGATPGGRGSGRPRRRGTRGHRWERTKPRFVRRAVRLGC